MQGGTQSPTAALFHWDRVKDRKPHRADSLMTQIMASTVMSSGSIFRVSFAA